MTTILESLSSIAGKAGNLLTELQGQRLNETLKRPGDLLTRGYLASHAASTSTKLILNAPVAGALNIQKVGSDPIAVTKASFKAGSNAINVAVSSTPRIIRSAGADPNITEATY